MKKIIMFKFGSSWFYDVKDEYTQVLSAHNDV